MSHHPFQPPETEELQELLPAYEILSFIEAGGMGAVYHARQISLDREVAIKVLPREFGADEDFREQFQAEAKAMAKLNSPNLIGVYDFGEVDGMPYLVMEFVNGRSLHYSSHGKAIEQKTALEIILGVAEGLSHAHHAGIIHRDIKPGNILLNQNAQPKIGDFGLAKPVESDETDAVVFGTPGYTAPEIFHGEPAEKASDVFSVGVMLYVLLTGDLPDTPMVPVGNKVAVDPRINGLIQKATHESPAARYHDAGELATAVREILSNLRTPRTLATAQSTSPAALNAGPAASSPKALAADSADAAAPHPTTPAVLAAHPSHWGFLRNLVIILVLAVAIFGVWKAIGWKKARTEQKKNKAMEEMASHNSSPAPPITPLPPEPTPSPVEPEPEPETAREALARLRPALVEGAREEFPPGTLVRGNSRYLIIDEPRCWSEAVRFAEDHGGHLATLPERSDSGWLAAKLPDNSDAWLGAGTTGRNRWGWLDGSTWELNQFSSLTGSAAALSDLGTVRARPAGTAFPFVIQWHMDGSNPGSLASQWERTKKTLATPNPIWPPGSFHQENRHFLLVSSSARPKESRDLAGRSGAHFAVPSDEEENEFILKSLAAALPSGSACWIGGENNGRAWQWITGEPWTFATWQEGSPDGTPKTDRALRIVIGPDGGWDDANPRDKNAAGHFLLEWSKDKDRKPDATAVVPTGAASETLLRLQGLAKRAFEKQETEYLKLIKANGVGLAWALDFWLRGLPGSQQETYQPSIDAMKARIPDEGVIPANIPREAMPIKIAAMYDEHLAKQETIEEAFLAQLDKLRLAYLGKLLPEAEKFKTAGDRNSLETIENEIRGIGQNGASFRNHLERLR